MQFTTFLLTIVFVFHLQVSRCAPLVQTGAPRLVQPVRLLLPHLQVVLTSLKPG